MNASNYNDVEDILDSINIGQLNTDMTSIIQPSTFLNNLKFKPSLQMKVGACIFLVLLVSIALLRISNSFIRVFGFILLLVSVVGAILFILTI